MLDYCNWHTLQCPQFAGHHAQPPATGELMAEQPSKKTALYTLSHGRTLSVQDMLDYFSREGSMRVSDLHLKAGAPPTYRVDGNLMKLKGPPLNANSVRAVCEIILSEVELELLRENRSVDTSTTTGKQQFRINAFYDNEGMAMAIRALEAAPPSLEQIGFPNDVWFDIIHKRQGLVLLTGITGSGKSTTIASLLHRIAETRPCRIITLEDPIEYRMKSSAAVVSQREVGRDVPSFEAGVRDALREDPDIIFVGEMRDQDSAAWALTAAETGHLVFSTLHTRDCRGSITRLLDMFPSDRKDEIASQLSLGLSHIICQKLLKRADGKGRVVAMEILNNVYAVSNLIRLGKIEQVYSTMQTNTKDLPDERMITMERSLANLVRDGYITHDEAEKWCNDWSSFSSEMDQIYKDQDELMSEQQ
jgi:twitching motility protein PilT